MLVLRVYGDSISMPRYADGIAVEKSWPELVREKLEKHLGARVILCNRSVGGATIDEIKALVYGDSGYFTACSGLTIVFCGIVDCAPRPVPLWLRNLIGRQPRLLRDLIIDFIHRHRSSIQRIKYWNLTGLRRFRRCYGKILRRLTSGGDMVLTVGIGPVSDEMRNRSYGLEGELKRYNAAIKELACCSRDICFLDLERAMREETVRRGVAMSDVFLHDGHHYSGIGNQIVADVVVKKLTPFVRQMTCCKLKS